MKIKKSGMYATMKDPQRNKNLKSAKFLIQTTKSNTLNKINIIHSHI